MEDEWFEYTGEEDLRRWDRMHGIGGFLLEHIRRIRVAPHITKVPVRAFFAFCGALREVDLANATEIGEEAFNGCTELKEITLRNVNKIGKQAFYECIELKEIDFANVTEIGDGAFGKCLGLGKITLRNVKTIEDNAFGECSNLTAVELPESCGKLGAAFMECENLESVVIPSTVTEIGFCAFYGCTKLAAVELPRGIQTIGQEAFDDCGLERITIPSPAFVISEEGAGNTLRCQLSRDATVSPHDVRMIVSKHVECMSPDRLEEAGRKINQILMRNEEDDEDEGKEEDNEVEDDGDEGQWQVQIRKLFAYYELLDATTILELAIWKAKMDQSGQFDRGDDEESSQERARVESSSRRNQFRTYSGAHIILPLVVSYIGELN